MGVIVVAVVAVGGGDVGGGGIGGVGGVGIVAGYFRHYYGCSQFGIGVYCKAFICGVVDGSGDKEPDRQRNRKRARQREKQTERKTGILIERHSVRQIETEIDRWSGPTGRHRKRDESKNCSFVAFW